MNSVLFGCSGQKETGKLDSAMEDERVDFWYGRRAANTTTTAIIIIIIICSRVAR